MRKGLFAVDMLPCIGSLNGLNSMPMVGGAHEDSIDLRALVELAKIAVGLAVLIPVGLVDPGGTGGEADAINITYGDDADGLR